MKNSETVAIDQYLKELEVLLEGSPREKMEALKTEIRDHLNSAFAEVSEPTADEVRRVFLALGSPEAVAAEFLDRRAISSPQPGPPSGLSMGRALGWVWVLQAVALLFLTGAIALLGSHGTSITDPAGNAERGLIVSEGGPFAALVWGWLFAGIPWVVSLFLASRRGSVQGRRLTLLSLSLPAASIIMVTVNEIVYLTFQSHEVASWAGAVAVGLTALLAIYVIHSILKSGNMRPSVRQRNA